MAVSWIKIEVILPDKEEVVRMAEILRMKDSDAVVGKLIRLWAWADQQTVDGVNVRVSCAFIDRLVFCPGFARALVAVGWLEETAEGLRFPHFERHNGASAKRRADVARAVAKHKSSRKITNSNQDVITHDEYGDYQSDYLEKEEDREKKDRGRVIPPLEVDLAQRAGFPSPLPGFEKVMRDGVFLPEFVEFVGWVKSVRPGWDVGRLTRREGEVAQEAFASLARPLTEKEKLAVVEYLASEPANGGKFDYPPDRELFMRRLSEVVQKAVMWWQRSGRKTPEEQAAAKHAAMIRQYRQREKLAFEMALRFETDDDGLRAHLNGERQRIGLPCLTADEWTEAFGRFRGFKDQKGGML